jgi:hypothetical protein
MLHHYYILAKNNQTDGVTTDPFIACLANSSLLACQALNIAIDFRVYLALKRNYEHFLLHYFSLDTPLLPYLCVIPIQSMIAGDGLS